MSGFIIDVTNLPIEVERKLHFLSTCQHECSNKYVSEENPAIFLCKVGAHSGAGEHCLDMYRAYGTFCPFVC